MLVSCYHVELFSSLLVYSLDFTVTFVRMLVLEQVNHVHYRSILVSSVSFVATHKSPD